MRCGQEPIVSRLGKNDAEAVGVLTGIFRGKLDVQTIGLLMKLQLGIGAEQGYFCNFAAANGGRKRPHNGVRAGRPGELDRVQNFSFGGEAKILRGVVCRVGVVERAGGDFRRPFAVNPPRARALDGVAVHGQPRTHVAQHLLDFVGNSAIGMRANVQ
jgi:hypothetical protein